MTTNNSLFRRFWERTKGMIRDRFDLTADSATQQEVVANISNGVEFRGTNLWVLIFATLVASLGLNVNSPAVIIGAMCISPLMGPIVGFGLALAVNDFELMKKSLRNLGFMAITAIVASTIFFVISPISTAQSELLARTVPTLYDVLIALFGGAAGIIAQTRKDRTSTVIPGVAIATALMPPLCTAGYGLATLQFSYFIGALYLCFINMVCIAIATFAFIRFLKYPVKTQADPRVERRVRYVMSLVLAVVLIPSSIIALRLVRQTIFESNAERYVATVFNYNQTRVLECNKTFRMSRKYPSTIEVVLFGETISQDAIENARSQMATYGLEDTELVVKQTSEGRESTIDFSLVQKSYSELLAERNDQITRLRSRLREYQALDTLSSADMTRECAAVVENLQQMSIARQVVYDSDGRQVDTLLVCIVKPKTLPLSVDERDRLERWLKVRGKCENIMLYVQE
ncbi:MAG: TIGR00341 family protein [Rikenellaceae bacterium]|nr:TIGR00341 family protein [Rikenellaceae bacterium]